MINFIWKSNNVCPLILSLMTVLVTIKDLKRNFLSQGLTIFLLVDRRLTIAKKKSEHLVLLVTAYLCT